jgi:outer membrane immunogenic protein
MFKSILATAVALSLVATPAAAQTNAGFTGTRVELNAGLNDFDSENADYSVAVGADAPLGDRVTLGAELTGNNVVESHRTVGAAARLGYAITPNTLAFARAGYDKLENLDNPTLGAGLNFRIAPNTYASAEYRYRNEHNNDDHGARIGIGLRF